MKPTRKRRLSRSNIQLLIIGWIGSGILLSACVFVGIILALGDNNQIASRPTRTPRATLPTPTALLTTEAAPAGPTAGVRSLQDDGKFALGGQLPAYKTLPTKT